MSVAVPCWARQGGNVSIGHTVNTPATSPAFCGAGGFAGAGKGHGQHRVRNPLCRPWSPAAWKTCADTQAAWGAWGGSRNAAVALSAQVQRGMARAPHVKMIVIREGVTSRIRRWHPAWAACHFCFAVTRPAPSDWVRRLFYGAGRHKKRERSLWWLRSR